MSEHFHHILEDRIASKNISSIAKELDIPKSLLHDWVVSGRTPSLKNIHHIESLANYLGLTLDELLIGNKEKKIISSISFEDEGRKYQINIERIK